MLSRTGDPPADSYRDEWPKGKQDGEKIEGEEKKHSNYMVCYPEYVDLKLKGSCVTRAPTMETEMPWY